MRGLPFESGHADVAVAIHVLEHFYRWDANSLLLEWKRVLKPGGKLILELPCMDKVFFYIAERIRLHEQMDAQLTWHALWGHPGYGREEMCHRWGYTKNQLVELLQEVGFVGIEIEKPRYHIAHRDMRVVAYKEIA